MTTELIPQEPPPTAAGILSRDKIIAMPFSEFMMLLELLETAFMPRVKYTGNMAEMKKEADGIMRQNLREAIALMKGHESLQTHVIALE